MVKSAIAYPSDNVDLPHSLIFIATCRLSLVGKVEEHRLHKIALEPKESHELQRWGVEDADTERGYHASVLLRRLKSPDDPQTQVYHVVSNRFFIRLLPTCLPTQHQDDNSFHGMIMR